MIFIHILFFPLTTPSLSGLSGSLGRNSITLSGGRPGLGPRSDPGTLGRTPPPGSGRASRLPQGSPSRGPAQPCPARQPRRPRPGLSATPAPPAQTSGRPRGDTAREGKGLVAGQRRPQLTMAEEPRARPQPRVTRRRQRPLSW